MSFFNEVGHRLPPLQAANPYAQPPKAVFFISCLHLLHKKIHGVAVAQFVGDGEGVPGAFKIARVHLPAGDVPYATAKALTPDFPQTGYFAFAME